MPSLSEPLWHELPVREEDGLLSIGDHQVMHRKEARLMKAFAEQASGRVLEIGYGLGVLSEMAHKRAWSHTVVEAHPVVAARAREWATTKNDVPSIIEGYWQDVMGKLTGPFDTIFHDWYLCRPDDGLEAFLPHATRLLAKGGKYVPWSGYEDSFPEPLVKAMLAQLGEVRLTRVTRLEPCVTWPHEQMILAVGVKR